MRELYQQRKLYFIVLVLVIVGEIVFSIVENQPAYMGCAVLFTCILCQEAELVATRKSRDDWRACATSIVDRMRASQAQQLRADVDRLLPTDKDA